MSRTLIRSMLPIALIVAACDSSTEPKQTAFDPVAIQAAMNEVVSSLEGTEEALASVSLAAQALAEADVNTNLLPAPGSVGFLAPRFSIRALEVPDIGSLPVFPANLLGKTFVFDAEVDRYVLDESLEGAPENGVRFIYYAVNPATRRPIEPLVPLGYLDITDESSSQAFRIGLLVVDTSGSADVTLLDYFIAASFTIGSSFNLTVNVDAEGFLSNGEEQLDFDIGYVFRSNTALEQLEVEINHVLSMPSRDLELAFVAEGVVPIDEEGEEEGAQLLAGSMTAELGGNVTVLEFEIENEVVDGTMRHNGQPVVLVSGTTDALTFTDINGDPLEPSEVQALQAIWSAFQHVWAFAERIFNPFTDA